MELEWWFGKFFNKEKDNPYYVSFYGSKGVVTYFWQNVYGMYKLHKADPFVKIKLKARLRLLL